MNTLFNKVFAGCNMERLNDPGTMRWYKKLCSLAKKGNKSAIKYKKLWLRKGIKIDNRLSGASYNRVTFDEFANINSEILKKAHKKSKTANLFAIGRGTSNPISLLKEIFNNQKKKMKNHVRIYLDHYNYGEEDIIMCESCGKIAVDVHHITSKSMGGKDNIENLIGLCRNCHDNAGDDKKFNNKLKSIKKKEFNGKRE